MTDDGLTITKLGYRRRTSTLSQQLESRLSDDECQERVCVRTRGSCDCHADKKFHVSSSHTHIHTTHCVEDPTIFWDIG
jgi:hypothetical protein